MHPADPCMCTARVHRYLDIATAEEILTYLNEAAEEQGLKEKMRFKTDISVADWKSSDNRWHLTTTTGEL